MDKKDMIRAYPNLSQSEKQDLIMNPWKLENKPGLESRMRTYAEANKGLVKETNRQFHF